MDSVWNFIVPSYILSIQYCLNANNEAFYMCDHQHFITSLQPDIFGARSCNYVYFELTVATFSIMFSKTTCRKNDIVVKNHFSMSGKWFSLQKQLNLVSKTMVEIRFGTKSIFCELHVHFPFPFENVTIN